MLITDFLASAACDGRCTAVLLVTACMATDLYVSKIYNFLTASAMAAGICMQFAAGRAASVPGAAGLALLTFILMFPFYCMHGIGAGDCKLLIALCFLLPMRQYAACLFTSFLLGAAVALAVFLLSGGMCRRIHFAVPVGVSTLFCIGGLLEPFYRYL